MEQADFAIVVVNAALLAHVILITLGRILLPEECLVAMELNLLLLI
jgi:hypothetical protein